MFKKNLPSHPPPLPLYRESCEPDMIACQVNMTSPASAAEQLVGGLTPVLGFFVDTPERHKTNFTEEERQRCFKLKESVAP